MAAWTAVDAWLALVDHAHLVAIINASRMVIFFLTVCALKPSRQVWQGVLIVSPRPDIGAGDDLNHGA